MSRLALVFLLTGLIPLAACDATERAQGDADATADRIVDSVFPVEEQIRRYQATVSDTPSTFRGGNASRDALVEAFLEAVEVRDAAALSGLVIDRAEYAFLYYPNSRFARPPYQLPPDVLWLQIQNTQSRSLTRLFRQLEERAFAPEGYRCEEAPVEAGPIRIWEDCHVLVPGEAEPVVGLRLFGSIVEHRGRFKFLSLSNEL
jgi:hypothetical protein